MIRRHTRSALAAALITAVVSIPALADGFIVPRPIEGPRQDLQYLTVKYHHVTIDVENQALVCEIDQVFHNENPYQVEGQYIFPVPEGAVLSHMTMEVDGEPIEGDMLPKDKAVAVYEDIVRQMKDPMLLEYWGRDLFRARIFPIEANGDKHVVIRYEQALTADNGVIQVRYPLNTEKFSLRPLEEVSVAVDIQSRVPIASVYSPSHDVDVNRVSDRHAIAGWEANNVKPEEDFLLYYTVSHEDLGVHVLSTMMDGEDEGYFLLMAAPPYEDPSDNYVPKDVVFVLDTSGSMQQDDKISQARDALEFCVRSLNDADRVNVVRFATSISSLGETVKSVEEARDDALEFVDGVQATGGTNMEGALEAAFESVPDSGRPKIVVLLSDGNPTVGESDPEALLKLTEKANEHNARLFVWGVGYDVNIHFLDKLAEKNRGVPAYIRPTEDIETPVSSFFAKMAHPALADIKLDIAGVEVEDMYPQEVPDLFYGSQLLLAGRYTGSGSATAVVRGKAGDKAYTEEFSIGFADGVKNDFVPRLWASRKIGFLLDQIRLHGDEDELVDEVVGLSMKFGIMTEYTAFLVTEGDKYARALNTMPGVMGGGYGGAAAPTDRDFEALDYARSAVRDNTGAAFTEEEGGWAMAQSSNAQMLRQGGQNYRNVWMDSDGRERGVSGVRYIAGKAFYNRNGRWEDATYSSDQDVTQIQSFSPAQFSLSANAPILNQYMSLGERVLINIGGNAVEIGPQGREHLTDEEIDRILGELKGRAQLPAGITPTGDETATAGLLMEDGGRRPMDTTGLLLGLGIVLIAFILVGSRLKREVSR